LARKGKERKEEKRKEATRREKKKKQTLTITLTGLCGLR
jgi:hypothetical protein